MKPLSPRSKKLIRFVCVVELAVVRNALRGYNLAPFNFRLSPERHPPAGMAHGVAEPRHDGTSWGYIPEPLGRFALGSADRATGHKALDTLTEGKSRGARHRRK